MHCLRPFRTWPKPCSSVPVKWRKVKDSNHQPCGWRQLSKLFVHLGRHNPYILVRHEGFEPSISDISDQGIYRLCFCRKKGVSYCRFPDTLASFTSRISLGYIGNRWKHGSTLAIMNGTRERNRTSILFFVRDLLRLLSYSCINVCPIVINVGTA